LECGRRNIPFNTKVIKQLHHMKSESDALCHAESACGDCRSPLSA
jgi:hypothetical protein